MRRRTGIALGGVAVLALLALLAWGLWPASIPDPVVRGRPLSAWLDQVRRPVPAGPATLSAEGGEAVRALGLEAVPTLLACARLGDSGIVRWSLDIFGRRGGPRNHEDDRFRAALGFQALGPAARPAWPALIDLALHGDEPKAEYARFALYEADAEVARRFADATADPDPKVRQRAILALGLIPSAAAEVALPTLERLTADADPVIAADATRRIAYIRGMMAWSAPNLKHPDADIRRREARFLGGHGPHARQYLPDLRAAADDPDPGVRAAVTEAIRRVEAAVARQPADGPPDASEPAGDGRAQGAPTGPPARL